MHRKPLLIILALAVLIILLVLLSSYTQKTLTHEQLQDLFFSEVIESDADNVDWVVLEWPNQLQAGDIVASHFNTELAFEISQPGYLFYIDKEPAARWGHQTEFVFVSEKGQVQRHADELWPEINQVAFMLEQPEDVDLFFYIGENVGQPNLQEPEKLADIPGIHLASGQPPGGPIPTTTKDGATGGRFVPTVYPRVNLAPYEDCNWCCDRDARKMALSVGGWGAVRDAMNFDAVNMGKALEGQGFDVTTLLSADRTAYVFSVVGSPPSSPDARGGVDAVASREVPRRGAPAGTAPAMVRVYRVADSGINTDTGNASLTQLRETLRSYAETAECCDEFVIFLASHGGKGNCAAMTRGFSEQGRIPSSATRGSETCFAVNPPYRGRTQTYGNPGGGFISAKELRSLVDAISAESCRVTLMVDACYSGVLTDSCLSGQTIITSTDENTASFTLPAGVAGQGSPRGGVLALSMLATMQQPVDFRTALSNGINNSNDILKYFYRGKQRHPGIQWCSEPCCCCELPEDGPAAPQDQPPADAVPPPTVGTEVPAPIDMGSGSMGSRGCEIEGCGPEYCSGSEHHMPTCVNGECREEVFDCTSIGATACVPTPSFHCE